jgi:DNA-binding transcriptional LysR family regulator
MELDWLETLLAVVDRGAFTAASEQLHRSQSRVSAHIAALERDLGVRLIDRTRRPATLTAAGKVFTRHAREIVVGVGSARSAVGAVRGLDQGCARSGR